MNRVCVFVFALWVAGHLGQIVNYYYATGQFPTHMIWTSTPHNLTQAVDLLR